MYQPLLEIDLTTGTMTPLDLPREVRERWLGGTGLGLYLLSKEIRRGMKVTDPDCPVFILTHHARAPIEMKGGTVFHFVTEGPEAALALAREAAGVVTPTEDT